MNRKMNRLSTLLVFLLVISGLQSPAATIKVSSLKQLAHYAKLSNNTIVMKPGTYKMTDYLIADSVTSRLNSKSFIYMIFSGNNNKYKLNGVTIEIDTRLREQLKFPIHTNEIELGGNNNTMEGLYIRNVNNGLSAGGATFNVSGTGNTIRNFKLWVQGSFPYGYGDLFGKGGPDVIRHKKQSGFLITGSNTRVYGCKLYMRSFGHGFYIQKDAGNIHFEDCYVEGEIRRTEDVLSETSGPAFDVNFRTWTVNREGKYIVTPGYMKSLCEDGYRTYNQNKNISFKNCTAKNTRAGFELRTNGGVRIENCTAIGTERAYWVGNDALIKGSRGDANYGPLLFVEGNNVNVELEVLPFESDRVVHALATIQGVGNKVVLRDSKRGIRKKALPVLIGYTHPEHGEAMSPYSPALVENLHFINKTDMPVLIGNTAINCRIESAGVVKESNEVF